MKAFLERYEAATEAAYVALAEELEYQMFGRSPLADIGPQPYRYTPQNHPEMYWFDSGGPGQHYEPLPGTPAWLQARGEK